MAGPCSTLETGAGADRRLTRGRWNESAGAFTQSVGTDALDASALMLPIVGFLPAADPRMLARSTPSSEG